MVGITTKASDTRVKHTRHHSGQLWNGPFAGAGLIATEQLEETVDGSGAVISSQSVVSGHMIVPGYIEFDAFDGVTSLPPLEITFPVPSAGWKRFTMVGTSQNRDYLLSCEELDIVDFSMGNANVEQGAGANPGVGRLYTRGDWTVNGREWGRVPSTSNTAVMMRFQAINV